jgi:hypothetical protein
MSWFEIIELGCNGIDNRTLIERRFDICVKLVQQKTKIYLLKPKMPPLVFEENAGLHGGEGGGGG